MPQEIQVWYILPALRREFATHLVEEHGFSQKKTAEKLGVTEAAVSQYFGSKRGKKVKFDKEAKKKIKESCKKVVNQQADLQEEMYKLTKSKPVKESMCKVHREKDSEVDETCKICFR